MGWFRRISCLSYSAKLKMRKQAVVVGGILIHLTLGNLYSFGNMMTYMVSYMHLNVDSSVNYGNFVWVNSICVAAQGLFMAFGGVLEKCIGPKLTCLIGCSLLSAGIMLTYYAIEISLYTVILTYGFLSGLGISLAYVTPLACGMQWYPQRKGLINGLIVGGFGLGALGSTTFQTYYLNPQNISPQADGFFTDSSILERLPSLFYILGCVFLAMQLTGCLLLSKPSGVGERCLQEGENLLAAAEDIDLTEFGASSSPGQMVKELQPKEVIRNKTFYVFWMIYLLNTIAVGYINAMYKSFGQTFINDDHFLAQIGSFASIFNAVGRVLWGRLMDKTSFKTSMRILATLLSVFFGTMPLTQYMGKVFFSLWVWIIFFTFSGTFVLMPTVIEKAFGSKHYSSNYGLLFTSQTISGPLVAAVNQSMLHSVGYTGCFLTVSFIVFLSVGLTFLVPGGL
ncbi:hypothetical protein SK128_018270 [Halocaridina rubra]|uniref:Major facilitator superfamily (MFS) profile domain-containing protein n=1 Tax=Halocaridina rubra TaxID=373956 RepID=A0AAN8WN41_HALRR